MTAFELFLGSGLLVALLLLLALLLRRPALDPALTVRLDELAQRLQAQEALLAQLQGQAQMLGTTQEARLQGLVQTTAAGQEALREAVELTLAALRQEVDGRLAAMTTALREQLEGNGGQLRHQLSMIQESVAQQLTALLAASQQHAEQLRGTLNERLATLQADNAAKLEEMRKTVDEKLHATLEQRLGQSFQLVSERLEQVHRGLGEMQNLAAGVGDLKRVLTNVKTRGTWGEVQLDALIGQILAPSQYARNVATRPGASERVEFALRLPGNGDAPVWLPIDAKFPVEDYQRLLEAHDRADAEGVEAAARALEARLKSEAKTIREKYIEPPATTDFAVLYLPTEGLYAEALRRPGLAEALQREQRVTLAGPTTLAALLNSLQMGFRTLAIEQRASEVWQVLGQVKTEFGKFGKLLEATKAKLDQARSQFDKIDTRSKAIERRLRKVEALPSTSEDGPDLLTQDD